MHPPASNCSANGFSGLVAHSWKKAYPDLLPFASVPLHLANFAIQPSWLFPFIVLCPKFVLFEQIPLGQVTSLHSLRRWEYHPPLFGVSSVLLTCRTSHVSSSLSCSLGIHSSDLCRHPPRPVAESPGSCARRLYTCPGSWTTQSPVCSLRYRYSRRCPPPCG